MKCPNCGKWNVGSNPHCVYCGTVLSKPSDEPSWMQELDDQSKPKAYIRVQEDGEVSSAVDYRDALAQEMSDLKFRKRAGETQRRQLIERPVKRRNTNSPRNVRTVNNQGIFFSEVDVEDPNDENVPELTEDPSTQASQLPPIRSPRFQTSYVDANGQILNIEDDEHFYDGYKDQSSYYPTYSSGMPSSKRYNSQGKLKNHAHSSGKTLRVLLIILLSALLGGGAIYLAFSFFGIAGVPKLAIFSGGSSAGTSQATVSITLDEEGLLAHNILIPGKDGQRITLRELRTSAIVTDGVASFTISDHRWYDDYENFLQDSMRVTLTPFVVADNGQQTALPEIQYDIEIPSSTIELDTPSSVYQVVSTTLYNIVVYVQPGSTVTVNGDDYSDLVDIDTGKFSYNATVQPIGDNVFTITSRSQYCRENSLAVTLYRAKQDIPLDLASDISSTSSSGNGTMTVSGTTLPGAVIKVLSPHMDLDITNTAIDGSFSFVAKFETIGENTIIITADYPGKETTRVEHIVNYVPNIDIYSRKAWDLYSQYSDLMDNLDIRKKNTQIYVGTGIITSIDTTKPQRCFMNIGTDDNPLLVYIENSSKTTWELGKKYRIYGDVYGMYDSKPWLIVRYTYTEK